MTATVETQVPEDYIAMPAAEVARMEHLVETLEESLLDAQRLLAADDYGWSKFGDATVNGTFTRDHIRQVSALARMMATADPLIRRAVVIHSAYLWGSGCAISAQQENGAEQDVNQVVQDFLDHPLNQKSFTSNAAREQLEKLHKTDGEFFLALFTAPLTGQVQVRQLPTAEITEVISNPEDSLEVWFYKRTFTAKRLVARGVETVVQETQEVIYYPDVNYRPRVRARRLNGHVIQWDSPVVHSAVNVAAGRGVPDLYAALPWARGYKGFLEDWATLIKALSRFAFRATAKNRAGGARTREVIATRAVDANGQAGATVIQGEGQTFEAIGKSGATIDSESGRPLAAMVAAATDVPVTILLGDPGVTGARATAETLDRPFHEVIKSRRSVWTDLIRVILDYVVREAVRAPRGPLKGVISRDPFNDRELVALRGDQPIQFEVDFPKLDKADVKTMMDAIKVADDMDKLPPLLVARLAMLALDVDDLDKWLEEITDEDGNFIDPVDAQAARSQVGAVRRGDQPGTPAQPEDEQA